jgi:hypothetical protein
MTPRIRKLFTFPIDDDLDAGIREIEDRDGISKAEQIRRGLRMWLESKGVRKAERKRVAPRKRS